MPVILHKIKEKKIQEIRKKSGKRAGGGKKDSSKREEEMRSGGDEERRRWGGDGEEMGREREREDGKNETRLELKAMMHKNSWQL